MARRHGFRHSAVRLGLLLLLALPSVESFAGGCAPSGAEALRLQRQVAANLSLARGHDCGSAGTGFACREIAARVVEAKAQLARLAPACPVKAAVAPRPLAPKPIPVRMVASAPSPVVASGRQTLCVRLSDGYYFPTPNSGFQTTPIDRERLNEQCRFICETADMDVFVRNTASSPPQDMVSLSTGKAYGELTQAGLYRKASAPKTCDMGRFYHAALQAAAPSGQTGPVETSSAVGVVSRVETAPATLFADVSLRGTTTDVPQPPRRVRLIGPAFLPAL